MVQNSGYGMSGRPVLVLEDSQHDQDMIRRALRSVDQRVEAVFVTTIAEARKALLERDFGAILCDNSLPDGSGSDFARELAGQPRYCGTPIAVVSGWPSPFMWDKLRQAGLKMIDKTDNPMGKLCEFIRKTGCNREAALPMSRH